MSSTSFCSCEEVSAESFASLARAATPSRVDPHARSRRSGRSRRSHRSSREASPRLRGSFRSSGEGSVSPRTTKSPHSASKRRRGGSSRKSRPKAHVEMQATPDLLSEPGTKSLSMEECLQGLRLACDHTHGGMTLTSDLTREQAQAYEAYLHARGPLLDIQKVSISDEEAAEIRMLRERLGPGYCEDVESFCTDRTLLRYLRARKFNTDKAANLLEGTVRWRHDIDIENLHCPACQENPMSHDMRVMGFDLYERPVMYGCVGVAQNREPYITNQHVVCQFEKARLMMDPEGPDQMMYIVNFRGFGFGDMDPRSGYLANKVFGNHYPEQLFRFVLVDPPSMFWGLWRMIKPVLDPVTKEKVLFVYSGKHADGPEGVNVLLKGLLDPALFKVIMDQVEEDRHAQMSKSSNKKYEVDLGETAEG